MSAIVREALADLLAGTDLQEPQAHALLLALTDETLPPALAGGLLAALGAKGVRAPELRGFARGMRSLARRPDIPAGLPLLDIVGTGGDGSHSYNLSTGSALLAAACGVPVAKHGNRSVSSRCGSADVLEAIGLALPLDEDAAGRCLKATGFTFLFAPHYHPAMRAIAPVRAALGVRTVFNLLGPLTNPAQPPFAVIGTWSEDAARLMAEALCGMPVERAFVVHGASGWDEPTPAASFLLLDVCSGNFSEQRRDAAGFGLPSCAEEELRGAGAAHNAAELMAVLRGEARGAHRDALVMGAALALEVTGRECDPQQAARAAASAIDDGRAARLLGQLAAFGGGR